MLISPQDYSKVLFLCANELGPPHLGLTLGVGDAILIDAISQASGKSTSSIKEQLKTKGDLGDIAQSCKTRQQTLFKPKPLTVPFVFNELMKVAKMEGQRSRTQKTGVTTTLLVSAQGSEAKFLVRSLQGRIRIGASEATITSAMSRAAVSYQSKVMDFDGSSFDEADAIIKQAFAEINDLGSLGGELLKTKWDQISKICNFKVGFPVKPMLAKPTKSISEVLSRFETSTFTCEYKYDGERAQVHLLENGSIKIYSRNCEDHTPKYPDLVELFSKEGGVNKDHVSSFVIDCEVVAFNQSTGKIESFQKLATRARKDVSTANIEVTVCLFGFDLMYLNGVSKLTEKFSERRGLLHSSFNEFDGKFKFAKYLDCSSLEDISAFLDEAVNNGTEGLMVKTLDQNSEYCPARRSYKWLKVKKDYVNELGDSLDLVPIGAFYGKGKRSGQFASYIVAIYDEESEMFHAVTKVGTGFSDEVFANFTALFQPFVLSSAPRSCRYGDIEQPDVYFDPEQHSIVWEVKAADLSLSPKYPAAKGIASDKGIALRFPRFIRVREDKQVVEATDSHSLVSFYNSQSGAKEDLNFDDDFF
ncbi:hypothetical protein GEMRC1_001922 [Eukaryota sp. GEM-RC1]